MATARDRISPKEFQGTIKRLSKATYKTSYVPKKVAAAITRAGAGRFRWQSATKREFRRTIDLLRAQSVLKAKRTTKQLYEDVMAEREAAASVGSDVPLAATKLPGQLPARKFIEYYGKATGHPEHVKAALKAIGLPTGAEDARPGAEERLNRRQMVLALRQLRETGKLTHANIGKDIARSHQRTQISVQEGIAQELSEQEQRRYNAVAREDLPEGIRRSIGRPAAGSALASATGQQRSTSAGRATRQQPSDDLETHATTASALARHEKPDDPKTSITRRGQRGAPAAKPDLPDLSFDLE